MTRLKAADSTVLSTYPMGQKPGGLCFDGTNIWVTSAANGYVIKEPMADMPNMTSMTTMMS